MIKPTFKQYLESRDQLLKAIENTPTTIVEYEIRKYCSLAIGENEEDKNLVGLKPKHKIVVEWRYDSVDDPTPASIQFVGPKDVMEGDKYATFWTGSKLQKWLQRHAKEGQNNGHKI